jgi:translation initiation factor 2 subunit 1
LLVGIYKDYDKYFLVNCLLKRKGLPELNELVLCTVVRISPFAAWVKLEEYPHLEGMIHISEVAGKWVHDIREFVKSNKQYVCKVIRVEPDKNIVNLSLKRVSETEKKEKINAFRREQRAEKILAQAAAQMKKDLESAYQEVGFLLQEKFGGLFVAFEEIRSNPKILEKLEIDEKWKKVLLAVIEKNIREKETILKAELQLKSYAADGIDRIKSLLAMLEQDGFQVKYLSAPRYRIELKTDDPKSGEKVLKQKIEAVLEEAKKLQVESSYVFLKA